MNLLADTSVWIEHFRSGHLLNELLTTRQLHIHPFIIGELAVGSLRNRTKTLTDLSELVSVTVAEHTEVLALIEAHRLYSRGIGYVEAHLLASVRLTPGVALWSLDKCLANAAEALGVAADIH